MVSRFIVILALFAQSAQTAVEPPNYNFDLEQLMIFLPSQNLKAMTKAHGSPEVVEEQGPRRLLRFEVAHRRYRFPVFVEFDAEKAVGFFARLPSYFLHDLFHQALINRFGPQDRFVNRDSTSVYLWKQKEGLDLIYSGACTITCFPIYLAGTSAEEELLTKFRRNPK